MDSHMVYKVGTGWCRIARQALVTEGQGLEPTKREKRDKRESDCDSESKRGQDV